MVVSLVMWPDPRGRPDDSTLGSGRTRPASASAASSSSASRQRTPAASRSYDRPVPLLPASPIRRDLLLATVFAGLAQVELFLVADRVDSPGWYHLAELLILPALALRRIAPLGACAFAAVSLGLEPLLGPAPVAAPFLSLLLVLASVGWYGSLRTGLLGVGMILAGGLVHDFTTERVPVGGPGRQRRADRGRVGRGRTCCGSAPTAGSGPSWRPNEPRPRPPEAERARIAGDLHDSLAHALTLITLQAGSARERTEHALAAEALAVDRADRARRPGRHAAVPGAARPGLAGRSGHPETCPAWWSSVRSGGLEVELDTEPGQVTPGISTTVFRVVQEALTNVVRHSDARDARVAVHRDGAVLVARVSRRRSRRSTPSARPGLGPRAWLA